MYDSVISSFVSVMPFYKMYTYDATLRGNMEEHFINKFHHDVRINIGRMGKTVLLNPLTKRRTLVAPFTKISILF